MSLIASAPFDIKYPAPTDAAKTNTAGAATGIIALMAAPAINVKAKKAASDQAIRIVALKLV